MMTTKGLKIFLAEANLGQRQMVNFGILLVDNSNSPIQVCLREMPGTGVRRGVEGPWTKISRKSRWTRT